MGREVAEGEERETGEDGVFLMADTAIDLAVRLSAVLDKHKGVNKTKLSAYEGKRISRVAGVKVTSKLRKMAVRVGWPRTIVDVLEERLDFLGWDGDDLLGLQEVFGQNNLGAEASLVHSDSLIYGVGFALVGVGDDGGIHVTAQSPFTTTGEWDGQTRRLKAGLRREENMLIVYQPEATTYIDTSHGKPRIVNVDEHVLGRIPLVMFPNRTRGSRSWGQSEISPMVLDLTDEASRTLLDMAVHRTFHASPQRYVITNMDKEEFENSGAAWKALTDEVWGVRANPDEVKIGELQGTTPSPFVQELQQLTEMLAAEAGIPVNYLGLMGSNPASADAIRAGEARLVKRAERHQGAFGASWMEVARMILLMRDGKLPDAGLSQVHPVWRDAATPTRAAAADEAAKLVGAGILQPDSSIVLSRLGFTPQQQAVIKAENEAAKPVDSMGVLADAITQQVSVAAPTSE